LARPAARWVAPSRGWPARAHQYPYWCARGSRPSAGSDLTSSLNAHLAGGRSV
jgi:hypothetical protein